MVKRVINNKNKRSKSYFIIFIETTVVYIVNNINHAKLIIDALIID